MVIADALKRISENIKHNRLINSGDKVILTCSGGADSSAMLLLFSRLRHSLNISLLAVHVNHQLRGEASQNDELAVKELCLQLNIPLIIRKIVIPTTGNLESQARKLRFDVFGQILQNYHFNKVLLAHHRDDQAETVLLNLFRGAGVGGMAGIKPIADGIVHPMLCFTRQEIEELLISQAIPWRTDSTNTDNSFSRNRLRNDLIPRIKQDYNPTVVQRIAQQAEIFNQADLLLRARAKLQLKRITLESLPHKLVLSLPALQKLSSVEQYYRYISNMESDFMTAHFEAIADILAANGSKEIIIAHDVKVRKLYEELIFYLKEELADSDTSPLEIDTDRALAVYGDYRFSFKYLRVFPKDIIVNEGLYHILIDADKISYPFQIRFRQAGDRFIPFGMSHFKRLKEFFIDEKVPKYERDLVPIFDDGEKLFWIVGHRIDDRVRYDTSSTRYLQIIAEPTNEKPKRAANRK